MTTLKENMKTAVKENMKTLQEEYENFERQYQNFNEEKIGKQLKTQYNIDIKYNLDSIKGLRASIPFFMLEEEIEKLLNSLKTIIYNKN